MPFRRVGPWSGVLSPGRWGSSQLPRLCRNPPLDRVRDHDRRDRFSALCRFYSLQQFIPPSRKNGLHVGEPDSVVSGKKRGSRC
ncbi:MAG: hypothetical protein SO074_13090, partial [Bilophila wadsworthia]|nr:hypothetical protein [Bilophila wadsworthia]